VVLDTSVGSDTSRVEEAVHAHIARPVVVHGQTVLAEGARGDAERYRIHTAAVGRRAPATKKKDALEIAAPAAGGAIISALIGGKKGAAIGTVAGGGAGTAVVLSTRGKEVHLGKGTALTLRLSEPVTIRIRGEQ
jgi:hypothetical protein